MYTYLIHSYLIEDQVCIVTLENMCRTNEVFLDNMTSTMAQWSAQWLKFKIINEQRV